jgi:WXXGXW repeat (2 copies)
MVALLFLTGLSFKADAQRVRVRPGLPASIYVAAPGHAPYRGALWVGPEWRWHHGRYVAIPGYWARPASHHQVWIRGHWQTTRRGYHWIPGHWR